MSEVKELDWYMLAALGIVGGLIAIYLAYFLNTYLKVGYFSFLGAAGAILAIVWGADAVRRICKYGIGTGVPSIGMLAFGMGLLATLLGLKIGDYIGIVYAGPIVAILLSLVQGAIIGYIANSVLKMKIPTMQIGMTFIAGAASIILMGYTTTIAGSFDYSTMINYVFATGFIAPLFMIGALPMLHPFNACLGPDEDQSRTLTLAVEAGLLSTIMFGLMSLYTFQANILPALITIVLGLIGWLYAYLTFFRKVKESGVPVLSTGVLPPKEA
ncbi:MAG TPA: tetrahydromethanopterin S-methyltransferase subunit C [Methanocella sp.]|uniref:tetrahydromethanopterin S-methyltransferase subunit MtrC n=1 Tax=Methanocella sp. TaxID=2052833 RepID=UPI002C47911B|nr:tetrahydromethanopterin S-methyltransferase subunit C [Methanocella sp.]HTY89603.1 tetrahydromethanopterin S-methyltransferase subunit C [Methanocella sp.]